MPSMSDVTVYDGNTTPLAHTFFAIEIERRAALLRAMYRTAVAGVPLEAQDRLFLQREVLRSGVHKYEVRVEIPVMESISGQNAAGYTAAPKIAYTDVAGFYVFAHPRSQSSGRRNVRQLVLNYVRGLSTTQTVDTAGAAISALEHSIMPS